MKLDGNFVLRNEEFSHSPTTAFKFKMFGSVASAQWRESAWSTGPAQTSLCKFEFNDREFEVLCVCFSVCVCVWELILGCLYCKRVGIGKWVRGLDVP